MTDAEMGQKALELALAEMKAGRPIPDSVVVKDEYGWPWRLTIEVKKPVCAFGAPVEKKP